ncbi:MAG: thioesterase family protein [Bacteroidota bacterium]
MYLKEFEIRWSDVDANRHLANSAYLNFMSHTRMSYLTEIGFGHQELARNNMGPVIFHEHIHYFKEVFPGRPIQVSLEVSGSSENGMFFEFVHNFYDHKGRNFARCNMMGAWIDLKERKLIGLKDELLDKFSKVSRTTDFRSLTKEDTRKHMQLPKDLN